MKITSIEPFVCDGGLRQFGFLKVTTDEGIVGWSEIYDFTAVASLATAIRIIGREFIGMDPFRIEWFNERMWYLARPGITERIKVLAALDIALWDIKGKALGVPVYQLLGGKFQDRIPLYWSHFASYRGAWPEIVGAKPETTYEEWAAGARDVVAAGYKVLKTNLIQRARNGRKPWFPDYRDGWITTDTLDEAVTWIGTIRDVVGPDIGISVDVQFDYRMGGIVQAGAGDGAVQPVLARGRGPRRRCAARGTAPDDDALLPRRIALPARPVPAVLPEARDRRRDARDVVERRVRDAPHRRDGGAVRRHGQSPHNWMSPLCTMVNAQLCAALPNVEILEIDLDDVPWKMDLLTDPFVIENGELIVPDRPGWGSDINEEVVRAHPLPPDEAGGRRAVAGDRCGLAVTR